MRSSATDRITDHIDITSHIRAKLDRSGRGGAVLCSLDGRNADETDGQTCDRGLIPRFLELGHERLGALDSADEERMQHVQLTPGWLR